MTTTPFVIQPGHMSLTDWEHLWRHGKDVMIDPAAKDRVDQAAMLVSNAAAGDQPVYGVNTGFGNWLLSGSILMKFKSFNAI